MDNRNVIVAAILGLIALLALTLYYKTDVIEQDLLNLTSEALASANLPVDVVEFEGRDATLRGEVESEEQKQELEALVSEVWDVRIVENKLRIKEPPEPVAAVEPAELRPVVKGFQMMPGDEGAIVLRGQVKDEIVRNKIVAAVLDAFPSQSIDNQIDVSDEVASSWVDPLLLAIPSISIVKEPAITIPEEGTVFKIDGVVAAELQKVAVLRGLEFLGPAISLQDSLVVVPEEKDARLAVLESRIQNLQTTTRIQFKINTANLEELSKEVLNQVAAILNEAPEAQIDVEGHTDNLGSAERNMELSQQRADAVRTYLISQGVQADRLTAIGYGPTRPVATNSTRQGRITNRRVVFSLKGGS